MKLKLQDTNILTLGPLKMKFLIREKIFYCILNSALKNLQKPVISIQTIIRNRNFDAIENP